MGDPLGCAPVAGREPPFPLVVFDVDGTLVDDTVFVWETLHAHFGSDRDANRRVMQDYLAGRISYAEWFDHDICVLQARGADRASIDQALAGMRLMDGARQTLDALTGAGVRVAVISGSLDIVLHRFFGGGNGQGWAGTPFCEVFINRLAFDEAGRISTWTPTPYDMDHKADGLVALAERYDVPLGRTAFIGDNVNDLSIARIAGRAIAFNAKSLELRRIADVTVLDADLRLTLPFLLRA